MYMCTRTRLLVFDDLLNWPDCAYVLDGSSQSPTVKCQHNMTTSLQCTHMHPIKSWQFVCKPITSSFVRPLAPAPPIILCVTVHINIYYFSTYSLRPRISVVLAFRETTLTKYILKNIIIYDI